MSLLEEPTRPNSVYRYYDRVGRLIYIGVTRRPGSHRQHEHATRSDWFKTHVATQDVEQCDSPEEMLRVERELIQVYRPPFNKQHNENWEVIRAAYLAVVGAEQILAEVRSGERIVPPQPLAILRNSCGQPTLFCQVEGEELCEYGTSTAGEEPYDGSGICNKPDCLRCHLYFHGMSEALPIGYEEGRKDEARLAAENRPVSGPPARGELPSCGHCSFCMAVEKDPWDNCVVLQWTVPCEHCGRLDCHFRGAYQEGSINGYDYAADTVKADTERRLWDRTGDAYMASLYLRVGTSRRSPGKDAIVAEWDDRRLASVQELVRACREGRLDELTEAAKAPF